MALSLAEGTTDKEEQETLLSKELEKNQSCNCCRAKGCAVCCGFALIVFTLSVLVHLNWYLILNGNKCRPFFHQNLV